jgi:DNA-binding response OmpR family regulator
MTGDIVIVDDSPANLKLLEGMLLQQGHEVHAFLLASMALAAAAKQPPDLFLLDINMPEMNGYEMCERLKSAEPLNGVPVIFLSALSDVQDKVKAFRSGAVDYISKPFQFEEVHARVETHLKLHHLRRALSRRNASLEAAVAARTRELSAANERLRILDRSKNEFLGLISHELRTPLNGLLGAGELILDEAPATEANEDLRGLYARSRARLLSILEDAMLLAEIDVSRGAFQSRSVSLAAAMDRAIAGAAELARSRGVWIPPFQDRGMRVAADPDLLRRALLGLLETAIKFAEVDSSIGLSMEPDCREGSMRLILESRGATIPTREMGKFFEIFSIGEPVTRGGDLGLAAPLAYRILSLFGGSVRAVNREFPPGIQLIVSLIQAGAGPPG